MKLAQVGKPKVMVEAAWRAQPRLNRRYRKLTERRKPVGKVVTAMARELVGFIWSVGCYAKLHCTEAALDNAA